MSQTTKFPYDIPDDFECGCYEEVNIKIPEGEFSKCLTVEEQILYLYNEIEEVKQGGDLPEDILQRIENLETSVSELDTKTDNIETSITNINQEISNIKAYIEVVKSDISSLTLRVDTAETDITEAKVGIAEAKSTAESAASVASAAQETANSASTKATEAKTKADNAERVANEAKTTAENISSVANEAKTTAESASTTANEAKTTAENAETVANEAKTSAESVVTTANEAKTTAESASTTANEAKTTAENISSVANEAKTTAESAASAASTAQTKANEAKTTAESAASAASTAQTTAENAQTAAESAASAASAAQTSATNAANAADSANTKATDANIMASNAITKATDAANAANEALGKNWKIVKFNINQSDTTCEVFLDSYYGGNITSDELYHESADSIAYILYYQTELKAAAVVNSSVTDNTDFHDKINFNNTIIIPSHGLGGEYANKSFNVSSMSSSGYSLDTFDGVTFAIPFQMVKNADNQDLFIDFPVYSILASTPAEISVNYNKSDGTIFETIYDNVNIIISIGIKDSEPALLYRIGLPKSSGDVGNLYLGELGIRFL